MAKVVEIDGKKVVVVEREVPLNDVDKTIQVTQNLIDNIDRNILGLQQRREKLAAELQQLMDIKNSLPKETGPIGPALTESQL